MRVSPCSVSCSALVRTQTAWALLACTAASSKQERSGLQAHTTVPPLWCVWQGHFKQHSVGQSARISGGCWSALDADLTVCPHHIVSQVLRPAAMHHMCRQGTDMRGLCSQPQLLRVCRSLAYNNFSGQLPASWLTNTSFVALLHLDISHNRLSGSLPAVLLLGQLQVSLSQPCSVHADSAALTSRSPASAGSEQRASAVPDTCCTGR